MTFTIGNLIPNPHTPDSYEVEVTAMFGDGDGYKTVTVGPFPATHPKTQEALTSLVETLLRMETAYPSGRGGGDYDVDTYNHVKGFEAWFGNFRSDTEEFYSAESTSGLPYAVFLEDDYSEEFNVYPDWPRDPYAYAQGSFQSFEVFYYGVTNSKYAVEYKP